jgi:hypothetical protein
LGCTPIWPKPDISYIDGAITAPSAQHRRHTSTLQEIGTLELHHSSPVRAAIIQFFELFSFPKVLDLRFTFVQVETLRFLKSFFAKLRISQGRDFRPVQELRIRGPSSYECAILPKYSPPSGPSGSLALMFRGPAVAPDPLVLTAKKFLDFSPLSVLEIVDEDRLSAEV